MTARDRLLDTLNRAGKTRGPGKPVYHDDGTLSHYSDQYVDVISGDVQEACAAISAPTQIVKDLVKGNRNLPKDLKVTVKAADAFHLVDLLAPEAPPAAPAS